MDNTKGLRVGRTRRSTFKPPKTDIFEKYRHITTASERAIAFIEGELIVPTGRFSGKPYTVYPFQRDLLAQTLDNGDTSVIWSAPRGFSKSGILAALLVWALFDTQGAQVIAASTGMRTARIAYGRAAAMIENTPRLAEQAIVFHNAADEHVDLPHRGATMLPLPAEERFIVGLSPTLVAIDEVGYVTHETFEVLQTSMGKTEHGLLIGAGTPGLGITDGNRPNLMYSLRDLCRSDAKPDGLRYIEFAADPADDPADIATWRKANPALGILVDPKAVALDYATMPLARFQQMRLGLWSQHETAFVPMEAWDSLPVAEGDVPEGALVSVGFDGSISGDGTSIVIYEHATGRLSLGGYWINEEKAKGWKVPRAEVVETLRRIFDRYTVTHMYSDPWTFRSELEALAKSFPDQVVELNTGAASRMGPASDRFLQSVLAKELKWDGDPRFRANVLNAVAQQTMSGPIVKKDVRKRKIDILVSAILALEASTAYVAPEPRRLFIY